MALIAKRGRSDRHPHCAGGRRRPLYRSLQRDRIRSRSKGIAKKGSA